MTAAYKRKQVFRVGRGVPRGGLESQGLHSGGWVYSLYSYY